jgi:hypothetical protein
MTKFFTWLTSTRAKGLLWKRFSSQRARVWHFLSTHDAAYLMISHLAIVTKDNQQSLPKLVCLA